MPIMKYLLVMFFIGLSPEGKVETKVLSHPFFTLEQCEQEGNKLATLFAKNPNIDFLGTCVGLEHFHSKGVS